MRRVLVTIGLTGALFACSKLLAGELPSDFSQKYRSAAHKLQEYYSHATITGSVVCEYPLEERVQEQTYTYRANGEAFRLDVSTQSRRRGITEKGSKETYLATPTASFYGWGGAKAQPIDNSTELSYTETLARIEKIFPFNQPFSMETSGTLLDLLRKPWVKVDSPQKSEKQGKPLVKIRFDERGDVRDRLPGERAYVVLSPNEGWALREYLKIVGTGSNEVVYRGTVTYSGMRDGVPIVDRIETWEEKGRPRVCVRHEIVHISRVTHGDPNWVDFTADGFPGPP